MEGDGGLHGGGRAPEGQTERWQTAAAGEFPVSLCVVAGALISLTVGSFDNVLCMFYCVCLSHIMLRCCCLPCLFVAYCSLTCAVFVFSVCCFVHAFLSDAIVSFSLFAHPELIDRAGRPAVLHRAGGGGGGRQRPVQRHLDVPAQLQTHAGASVDARGPSQVSVCMFYNVFACIVVDCC